MLFLNQGRTIFVLKAEHSFMYTVTAYSPLHDIRQTFVYIIVNILSIVNLLSMIKCSRVIKMISYEPFYNTLLEKGITVYNLIYKQGMSANTFQRMKKGKAITTETLDTLCFILDCEVQDIIRHDKTQ